MRVNLAALCLQPLPGVPGRSPSLLKARLANITAGANGAFEPYAPEIFLAATTARYGVLFQVIFKPFFFF